MSKSKIFNIKNHADNEAAADAAQNVMKYVLHTNISLFCGLFGFDNFRNYFREIANDDDFWMYIKEKLKQSKNLL